jgi:hypothetical protein
MRWAGRLVIRRGNTEDFNSLGIGRAQRKSLLAVGIVEEEVNNLRYVDTLELACNGEVCGKL